MSETVNTEYEWVSCSECDEQYPVGGDTRQGPVESSPESAEHHAEDCPVRDVLRDRGQTADRDVHVEVDRDE